jgi:23S rRNA pseudouridine1911/1915/1917 synthase
MNHEDDAQWLLEEAQELEDDDEVNELLPADGPIMQMAVLRFALEQVHLRQRIDVFLTHRIRHATRNRVQKAIAEERVRVNGKLVKNSYVLQSYDVIEITIMRPAVTDIQPQYMPLDVCYEDDHMLVVNKPPGIAVHPTYRHWDHTMVNGVLYYRRHVRGESGELKPGLVHRLDKHTSGLLVFALSPEAHRHLAKQFQRRQNEKVYTALVWGVPTQPHGILETNLGKSTRDRRLVVVYPLHGAVGKVAKTEYELIESFGDFSLLRVTLHTGRMHQIRVHLQHLGHPIVGDVAYDGLTGLPQHYQPEQHQWLPELLALIPRQALHATEMRVQHPITREEVHIQASLPADIQAAISWLRNRPVGMITTTQV